MLFTQLLLSRFPCTAEENVMLIIYFTWYSSFLCLLISHQGLLCSNSLLNLPRLMGDLYYHRWLLLLSKYVYDLLLWLIIIWMWLIQSECFFNCNFYHCDFIFLNSLKQEVWLQPERRDMKDAVRRLSRRPIRIHYLKQCTVSSALQLVPCRN